MPEAVESGMKASIGRLALRLQRKVRQDKLTGQVLKVRTGTLRRSIDQVVLSEPGAVIGIVSTNVKYGKAHEYGYKGPVNIKAHMRLIKQAWGKPLKYPVWSSVKAHTANVDLPERSFLRSALRDMAPEIKADIASAINGAIRK
jgi:phage gpG-like protein